MPLGAVVPVVPQLLGTAMTGVHRAQGGETSNLTPY